MCAAPSAPAAPKGPDEPWYVYDRHLNLLHVAMTLADAEAWAIQHWGVVEVADREEVEENDYWYLLFAAPDESGSTSRDYQARIARRDRVIALGRDPDTSPRFP
jgi:hypothetical protein